MIRAAIIAAAVAATPVAAAPYADDAERFAFLEKANATWTAYMVSKSPEDRFTTLADIFANQSFTLDCLDRGFMTADENRVAYHFWVEGEFVAGDFEIDARAAKTLGKTRVELMRGMDDSVWPDICSNAMKLPAAVLDHVRSQ